MSICYLAIQGATAHQLPIGRLTALQALVTELGANAFPLFLRLGGAPLLRMQPVMSRALLREIEKFTPDLAHEMVPGLDYYGPENEWMGASFEQPDHKPLAVNEQFRLTVSLDGAQLVTAQFPPPVGFRSHPGLESGEYACFFREFRLNADGAEGLRTEAMGGSGAPVKLGAIPLPPVTRWHLSRVAGSPRLTRAVFTTTPAPKVFQDLLHALTTACNDSMRLKQPLVVRVG